MPLPKNFQPQFFGYPQQYAFPPPPAVFPRTKNQRYSQQQLREKINISQSNYGLPGYSASTSGC